MITLDEARRNIGKKVVYRAPHIPAERPGEEGEITSVNTVYVFVRYRPGSDGVATPPGCLDFVGPYRMTGEDHG